MIPLSHPLTRCVVGRLALLGALISAPLFASSLAAQVVYQGTPSSSSLYFSSDRTMSTVTYSVPSPSAFTYDFSKVGDVGLSVTWSAPAGEKFVVTGPSGFGAIYLNFRFTGGSTGGGGGRFSTTSPTVTFTGAEGTLTNPSASVSLADPSFAHPSFGVQYTGYLSAGQSFSFSSLTISTTIPASYNGIYPGDNTEFLIRAGAINGASGVADPGAWMTTASAIPEPSTYAAIFGALALGAVAVVRRRRPAALAQN